MTTYFRRPPASTSPDDDNRMTDLVAEDSASVGLLRIAAADAYGETVGYFTASQVDDLAKSLADWLGKISRARFARDKMLDAADDYRVFVLSDVDEISPDTDWPDEFTVADRYARDVNAPAGVWEAFGLNLDEFRPSHFAPGTEVYVLGNSDGNPEIGRAHV